MIVTLRSLCIASCLLLPLLGQPRKDGHKDGRKDDHKNDRHEDESFAERRVHELSRRFDLTESQKRQALVIFSDADRTASPLEEKLEQVRRKLRDATRRNTAAPELEQLASAIGALVSQLELGDAKAETAFYNTLTEKQREESRRPLPPPRNRR